MTHRRWKSVVSVGVAVLALAAANVTGQTQMERLGRGVVAVRTGTSSVYVGWRLLGTDPANIAFNVYRGSSLVNGSPITGSTNLVDNGANLGAANTYTVRPVLNGAEQAASAGFTLAANAPTQPYIRIGLQNPGSGYTPGDMSVGDVDNDGEYEYFLKWDPSNQRDNSQSGVTSNVFIDCYRLSGTRLWRVNLGPNIRAGAHYTQFQVYDYDGDGRAELAVKTGDGSVSGTGQVIGNGSALHRNADGHVITGPEYLTVFDGLTGAVRATANFQPARGNISQWGDTYGNRGERYLAGTAYLDGQRPSIIMGRGYYELSKIAAWDFRNNSLTLRWMFDSGVAGSSWGGRGTHWFSVADVDVPQNGTQEIIYGGMTINANGTGRYTTSFYAHGDALHVSDLVPSRPGQEIWQIHESGGIAATLRDGNTGAIIFSKPNTTGGEGPARGVAGDVYAGSAGAEFWASGIAFSNGTGGAAGRTPGSQNFLAWWDADFTRELLDGNHVDKYGTSADTRLLTASGASSINGSKATPNLSADIFGDWREEIILMEGAGAVRIYTTTTVASNRVHTLMHDPQYRVQVACQNSAYNQPPHPSFYLGGGAPPQPKPGIVVVGGTPTPTPPTPTPTTPTPTPTVPTGSTVHQVEAGTLAGGTLAESAHAGFNGTGYVNFPASGGTVTIQNVNGGGGGSATVRVRFALGATASRMGNLVVNGATQPITFDPTGAWTTWADEVVTVSLNAGGSNSIGFASVGQDLGNIDQITVTPAGGTPTPTPTATPPGPIVYPAEAATLTGGNAIESTNGGFNGTGYVNASATGGGTSWSGVDGRTGGNQVLRFRYALGAAGSRTGNLVVNGATQGLTFNSTGAWTTWATLDVTVPLNAGNGNTVRLDTTGQDLANVDELIRP